MEDKTRKRLGKKTKIILWITIWGALFLIVSIIFFLRNGFKGDQLNLAEKAVDEVLKTICIELDKTESMPVYLSTMQEKSGYEILSVEEKDGIFVATITVHSPDLYSIAKKLDESYDEYPFAEEMDKIIAAEINEADVVTSEVEIVLIESADGYEALLTDNFANAYYGGILKLREEQLMSLWEEMKK